MAAYGQGIFPMGDDQGIKWYSPDPRAVFPLDAFHVPKTLAKTIRQGKFDVRVDTAFEEVLRGCAGRDDTWITREIHDSYTGLHKLGLAHSVEAWQDGALVGGLYGVALGGAFMGESMFSRRPDASKVCLVFLVERMRERGFTLLDSQFPTEHLMRFGQVLIRRDAYLEQLAAALLLRPRFT
ncbi:MAG: Leucyl/phenylalanyl-tRNA--protein transferase [Cyanobacteria bacterium RYN_339]|nr:Leucyl/phenylalanyl-tRNA--protein transferase [Cyanobacteria bacterium RYN_339]